MAAKTGQQRGQKKGQNRGQDRGQERRQVRGGVAVANRATRGGLPRENVVEMRGEVEGNKDTVKVVRGGRSDRRNMRREPVLPPIERAVERRQPVERVDLMNSAAERLAGKTSDVVDVRGEAPVIERRSWMSRLERWQERERWRLDGGLWGRVCAWWWGRRGFVSGIDHRQLDEVKASVMSELKNMRATRREVAATRPFEGPFADLMLPPKKRPGVMNNVSLPRGWVVFGGLVGVLAGVLWWLSGLVPSSPERVVSDALAAVQAGDVAALEERVDMDSVAVSVVDQVLTNPQVDLAVLPGDLQAELQQGLKARMEALIKPGLAAKMADDARALVKEKRLPAESGDGILGQVWHDLGGNSLEISSLESVPVDAANMTVRAHLNEGGAAISPPLDVSVAQQGGRWQVVGLPNLAAMIRARDAALRGAAVVVPVAPATGLPVVVENVVKAKGPEGVLLISADLANVSGARVERAVMAVRFADAAGTPLYATELTLAEPLNAGETRTQTWSVPLDAGDARAKYVYALPQSAMRTVVEVKP